MSKILITSLFGHVPKSNIPIPPPLSEDVIAQRNAEQEARHAADLDRSKQVYGPQCVAFIRKSWGLRFEKVLQGQYALDAQWSSGCACWTSFWCYITDRLLLSWKSSNLFISMIR